MIDPEYLRSFADRFRQLIPTLVPAGAPQTLRSASALEAMARDFTRWADEIDGKPKANGHDLVSP
jgi:hypothetical protein